MSANVATEGPPPLDVLVVGGGIPGLAFAALLAGQAGPRRLRLAVLDRVAPPPPVPTDPIGLRVLAIAPVARRLLAAAGAWAGLPPERAFAYQSMRVWAGDGGPTGPGAIAFDAADAGLPELGHIVDQEHLRWLLWQAVGALPGLQLLTGMAPKAIRSETGAMVLQLANGRELRARLIVGADGAASWVRQQLALPQTSRPYDQQALVTRVRGDRDHQATAWQHFLPTGPVALLPLPDRQAAVVWSCPDALAAELLGCPPEDFSSRLGAATGDVLGPLELVAPRAAVALAAAHTHRYTGSRFALLGDAAHQVHPLAGQGVNLGLYDAAALAETLAGHLARTRLADPGDARVLARYERWRKGGNLLTLGALDGLHRLFTSGLPGLRALGGRGLGFVDRLPPVKRLLVRQATGYAGRQALAASEGDEAGTESG